MGSVVVLEEDAEILFGLFRLLRKQAPSGFSWCCNVFYWRNNLLKMLPCHLGSPLVTGLWGGSSRICVCTKWMLEFQEQNNGLWMDKRLWKERALFPGSEQKYAEKWRSHLKLNTSASLKTYAIHTYKKMNITVGKLQWKNIGVKAYVACWAQEEMSKRNVVPPLNSPFDGSLVHRC